MCPRIKTIPTKLKICDRTIIDWYTRRVLAWRLSITLETAFCIEAVEEAMAQYGKPDTFNTDQGSQFTSINFTKMLKDADIKISMPIGD